MADPLDLAAYRLGHDAASITVGNNARTNTRISVSQETLQSGTYVLGVQGMGKTSLLEHIILQQLTLGESVIVLDPHGKLVWNLLGKIPPSRVDDTYFLDLTTAYDWPFGMNPFTLPPEKSNSRKARDSVRNQVIHAFEKLWPETKTGLYFGNVLRPVIATLLEQQDLTLAHVRRLFSDEQFRRHYTANLTDLEAVEFWYEYEQWSPSERKKQTDPFLDRLKKLLSQNATRFILCQKGRTLDLATMIKQKKNILLRLPLRDPVFEQSAPIIGTLFITLLQAAIFSFGNLPAAKLPSCTLVIDEFQNFVTEDNEKFFSEGRKFGVKQVLAHQGLYQLEGERLTSMKDALTSAHTIVTFRTNQSDGKTMANSFLGMKRRPTSIDIEPVKHLGAAKNPAIVKEFYRDYIKKLEEGAKMKTNSGKLYDEPIFPRQDFGFGFTSFSPGTAQVVLKQLNDLLYESQKEEQYHKWRVEEWLALYEQLVIPVRQEERDNPQVVRKIAGLEQERQRLEEEEKKIKAEYEDYRDAVNEYALREELRKLERDLETCKGKKPKLEARENVAREAKRTLYRQVFAKRNNVYLFWEGNLYSSWRIRLGDRDVWIFTSATEANKFQAKWSFLSGLPIDDHTIADVFENYGLTWMFTDADRKQMEEIETNRAKQQKAWEAGEAQIRHLQARKGELEARLDASRQQEQQFRAASQELRERIQKTREEVRELERRKRETVQVADKDEYAWAGLKQALTDVVTTLIQEPLAADSGTPSLSDISQDLEYLKKRHAYVKVSSRVYQMETIDLNKHYSPVPKEEAMSRRNRILKQTKEKYCRGRAQVEREIAEVYQFTTAEESQSIMPPEREAPGQLHPQKQRGIAKLTDDDFVE